ncbi:MFS transporter [Paenibacillus agricola]|uniref:MFS-type drug efflux transporter P55 n=1 Tax=Paenibacillus agricola TaxID=2716264 RepID=A0ABX0JA18_9BACL|nr:MFS transporter [Paenibacillus agricola]NHN30600.1 MFS transporter [Paenibacillus agricola]
MASVVIAMLVASMDTTIINTTMPIIAKELGGFQLYAWSFASYMVVSTVVAPVAGRISDLYGRKTIFSIGILIFMLGSLLCGFANTMIQLILFRAVQGIGAGVMLPFPNIIAGDLYPPEKRGKVQAVFTGMWALSAILAPLLGALFVQYASWRWIFYINIPLCLISLALLYAYKEQYVPRKSRVDVLGACLFATGVSLLLLTTVVESYMFAYTAAGIVVLVAFYFYEKQHSSPIVPLSLLANGPIAALNINGFLSCAALFGVSSYVPLFLQEENYSLFVSGLALLGVSFGWMVVAVPSGKWTLRWGYGRLVRIGNVLSVIAGAMLLVMKQGTGFWYVFAVMVVQGLAFGLIFTVSTIGSQQMVAADQKGISTSLQLFSRNIGTAVGVTVMGAFLTRGADVYSGFHALFVYGFIASLFALASSFLIRKV